MNKFDPLTGLPLADQSTPELVGTPLTTGTTVPVAQVQTAPATIGSFSIDALNNTFQTKIRKYTSESIYAITGDIPNYGGITIDAAGKFHKIKASQIEGARPSLELHTVAPDAKGVLASQGHGYVDIHKSVTDNQIMTAPVWKLVLAEAQSPYNGYKLANGRTMTIEQYTAEKAANPSLAAPVDSITVAKGTKKVFAVPMDHIL